MSLCENVGRIRERLKKIFNEGENVTKFKKMVQLLKVFCFRIQISAFNFNTAYYYMYAIINHTLF